MPKRKQIVWENIQESNLLILSDNETIRVEFLDNGYIDDHELDDGNIIDKYVFQVKDLNDNQKEKEWSTLANRCITKLKKLIPLKSKKFSIEKFTTGKEVVDKDFRITPI